MVAPELEVMEVMVALVQEGLMVQQATISASCLVGSGSQVPVAPVSLVAPEVVEVVEAQAEVRTAS